MQDENATSLATWNISKNENLTLLGRIAENAKIICLQEVHGAIKETLNLRKNQNYYEGKYKIGRVCYNLIYWDNEATENNSMGLAILWHDSIPVRKKGVYRFNANHGSPSERRGLPWIEFGEDITRTIKIYSYHSASQGDNSKHSRNVINDIGCMMSYNNQATFGDFNLTKDYLNRMLPDNLKLVARESATRPKSGKNIDYCLHKENLCVKAMEYIEWTGTSDHTPVFFSIKHI